MGSACLLLATTASRKRVAWGSSSDLLVLLVLEVLHTAQGSRQAVHCE
jgi:hypothetical protein